MRYRNTFTALTAGLILALLAAPAAAQMPFANPGEDAGRIVGTQGEEARDIYPVRFVAIDGKNIVPRDVIWLEPGKYTLTVSSVVTNPGGLSANARNRALEDDDINEIEVAVEAGKSYYIGVHYEGKSSRRPYSTVVYRVEGQE